jgi:hypothetical protein
MFKAFVYPIVLCRPFSNKFFDALIKACGICLDIVAGEIGERIANIAGVPTTVFVEGSSHETDFRTA